LRGSSYYLVRIISGYMTGRTEKDHNDPESGKQISLPVYELNASRIEAYTKMLRN